MIITTEILFCAVLLALFAGFCLGWKQREEKYDREEKMQASWEQLKGRLIRDGVLDKDGQPLPEKLD